MLNTLNSQTEQQRQNQQLEDEATPRGRGQPTAARGDCLHSSDCVAAHPRLHSTSLLVRNDFFSDVNGSVRFDKDTHLSGLIDTQFKATADHIKTEADEPVEHPFKEQSAALFVVSL